MSTPNGAYCQDKTAGVLSVREECPQFLPIDVGEEVDALAFTANGEHLVSGSEKGVQVWRVKDGKRVATMPVKDGAWCVATSKDGKFIGAGSYRGGTVIAWDSTTYEKVFITRSTSTSLVVYDVDFSPDSTQLVFADWNDYTATICDIVAGEEVQILDHYAIIAAKYSPQGDRIATAGWKSVRVWDSNDGQLLVEVDVGVETRHGLLWRDNGLFVTTKDKKVKQIDASTGSTDSEWPLPHAEFSPCLAVPQHARFIAFSADKTITLVDPLANSQPSPFQHTDDIRSMVFSCDEKLLAIAAEKKIIIRDSSTVVFRPISEPEIDIDSAALNAWKNDQLSDAEALLSATTPTSESSPHRVLAIRALIRARLGLWDAALVDAKQSIEIEPSLFAYVAQCVALVGKGEKAEGVRVCDTASEHHSKHVSLLLLIKAVVLFMAGDHVDAISLMNSIIADMWVDPAFRVVQAYMHLVCGNKHVESNNYERAVQSFRDARIVLGDYTRQPPLIVSLISGWTFDNLLIAIQQHLCEALLAADRATEAGESILRIVDQQITMSESIGTWVSDFKHRCHGKLVDLGDNAMNAKLYDEAVSQYKIALLLGSDDPQDLLVKRSKAYAEQGEWDNALNDANEIIKLDSSSPSGYERKYAALLGMGQHGDAIDAFETMLSKMSESADPETCELSCYVRPEQTMEAIRTSIKNAISESPLMLIDALSGRLCDKSEQAAAFESAPVFTSLVTSTTTHIDHALIEQVVGGFYRYATFSHTWEGSEPLHDKVIKTVVYDLEAVPTHRKLQMFCKIVRDEGFNWAWSDTCCIDKGDQFILQEALVSMFKWYEGSALTIIFLCDVDKLAELGALMMSLWNSRGWTLQEYHASKVVRIYTKDWTPYLGLTIYNHKESPEIVSEMEKATGISAASLKALRPGLNDIREKLRLASTRQTTRVEDAAYSLLGIFSMTLPITYGEGDKALGRLLSQLLTSSGDTSILAWTGTSSSFNSCLPTNIAVFSQPLTSYIPPAIPDAEMATITTALHASSLDLDLVATLYNQLNLLPLPSFLVQRMKLPCLAFKMRLVSGCQDGSEFVFRAQAGDLGDVEIKTRQNLTRLDSLYLVHPWIDFLLDRHAARGPAPDENSAFELDTFQAFEDLSNGNPVDDVSLPSRTSIPLMDAQMAFLARLKQPFGALLFTPTRRNVAEYRRVATESLITARVQDITSAMLNRLIRGVGVLDVL